MELVQRTRNSDICTMPTIERAVRKLLAFSQKEVELEMTHTKNLIY